MDKLQASIPVWDRLDQVGKLYLRAAYEAKGTEMDQIKDLAHRFLTPREIILQRITTATEELNMRAVPRQLVKHPEKGSDIQTLQNRVTNLAKKTPIFPVLMLVDLEGAIAIRKARMKKSTT